MQMGQFFLYRFMKWRGAESEQARVNEAFPADPLTVTQLRYLMRARTWQLVVSEWKACNNSFLFSNWRKISPAYSFCSVNRSLLCSNQYLLF